MINLKKLNVKKIMISSTILTILFSCSIGYSSSPRKNGQEMEVVNYDAQMPQSTTQLTPRGNTFAINVAPELEDFDLADIKSKTKQMYASAAATSVLGILTLYYACNTTPDTWLSGTAGSFCANFALTSMATDFLRRDRKSLMRRRKAKK